MHIVIPMSGVGQRFINAGYKVPKPLIEIDGKTIIEHVCSLFPGENKFTFICNSAHLAETDMMKILKSIKPNSNIIEIPPHKKGPVYAVSCVYDMIEDDEEIIVNYCDFGTYWDYSDFLKHTRDRNADGAVPSYKGFHPHMLGTTNYAFIRDKNQWLLEIQEKKPFTDNRMDEYASNGTYYFKKGSYLKKYFDRLMERDISLNGEYYVSMVYNLLVEDGLSVSVYNIQHMLQWGTPQDVEEYLQWSGYFRDIIQDDEKNEARDGSITLIPLAGRGSRFSEAGYKEPKPLIEVSGRPMIIQAALSLPKSSKHTFVALKEHLDAYPLAETLKSSFPGAKIIPLSGVTEGQAITCSLGLNDENEDQSLLVAATDNGMLYNKAKLKQLTDDEDVDAVVFTFRNHISSRINPHMYGWVKTDGEDAVGVSVKVPISDTPENDHAIVGTFYFSKVKYFNEALKSLVSRNVRVNNEFYVDSMIGELLDAGRKVKVFEVGDYICWGTPNDYETFVYWQSFFHKVSWHPYSLELDKTVAREKLDDLDSRYRCFKQDFR